MDNGDAGHGTGQNPNFIDRGNPQNSGQGTSQEKQILSPGYKFNQDELRTLRECNRESFFFRCLPLGTFLGSMTFLAVRAGHLKASPRWGAGPKMFGAGILGYFLGKFSYQQKCAEKLMALPNSQIGELLRQKKGRMGFQEALSMEPGFQSAQPILATPGFSESHSGTESSLFTDVGDIRPMSAFDNESSSMQDYGKSYDTTEQMLNDENLPQKRPQFTTSYDELRKQNRDQYEQRLQQSGLNSLNEPPGPSRRFSQPQISNENQQPVTPKIKNKYGDVWEDKPE